MSAETMESVPSLVPEPVKPTKVVFISYLGSRRYFICIICDSLDGSKKNLV